MCTCLYIYICIHIHRPAGSLQFRAVGFEKAAARVFGRQRLGSKVLPLSILRLHCCCCCASAVVVRGLLQCDNDWLCIDCVSNLPSHTAMHRGLFPLFPSGMTRDAFRFEGRTSDLQHPWPSGVPRQKGSYWGLGLVWVWAVQGSGRWGLHLPHARNGETCVKTAGITVTRNLMPEPNSRLATRPQ